jgi:serine phosphatase RsbU (regulator of sigma subunit)
MTLMSKLNNEVLEIERKLGNKRGELLALTNIGNVFESINLYDSALYYYDKVITGSASSYPYLYANTLANKSIVLWESGRHQESLDAINTAIKSAESRKERNLMITLHKRLSEYLPEIGRHEDALYHFKTYVDMQDSLEADTDADALVRLTYKIEYEKKAITDSILKIEEDKVINAQIEVSNATIAQQKQMSWFLIAGIGLVGLFGFFIWQRFKVTSKQKGIIEKQKRIVDEAFEELGEAHKEITDSINYAERIQRSFLAADDLLKENLEDYFVYFKPKEVVSGDFYWAGQLTNGNFAIVNADSTGHGVPGAIMSILNASSIEKAVENKATHPAEIFNQTRTTIIDRLKKDGSVEGGKDGMDACLIAFNTDKTKMVYVAAQNPIWIIRNGELTEIKPEKMPVGKHDKDHIPFTGGEYDILKGDQIYTLTDGFQDQFGGPKGKKFMMKKMREYVLSISNLPMEEQLQKISDTFTAWKGDVEQIDDVFVIGVRI